MPATPQFKKTRLLLVVSLVIPCLLICVPAVMAYRGERQLGVAFHWVSHTLEVQRELQRLLVSLVDAETGQRGFLLVSDEAFLEPYKSALSRLQGQITLLRYLTSDSPIQQEHLRQLVPLVAAKLDFMAQTIALQQRGEGEKALALIQTHRGKQTMDAIRARLERMQQEESRLLVDREAQLTDRAQLSIILLAALVALSFLFAGAVFILFRRIANLQSLVTVCAWSQTIEYEGQWLSFEEYLLRRFNLNTSHGISPDEAKKAFGDFQPKSEKDEKGLRKY